MAILICSESDSPQGKAIAAMRARFLFISGTVILKDL